MWQPREKSNCAVPFRCDTCKRTKPDGVEGVSLTYRRRGMHALSAYLPMRPSSFHDRRELKRINGVARVFGRQFTVTRSQINNTHS